ncbi:MFS general substrate transporter [Atractiella rhizophila]|nr:MFS general substrate transporter [Atractiella rhizophila]
MHFVTPFAFECIFPFVNQFIVELGVVKDETDAGFYSGLIESLFAIVQFIAVIPITRLADVIGRKPVLVTSTCGMGISLLLFSLSKSLRDLLLTRMLGGAFGGQLTLVRMIIMEISTRETLPFLFTLTAVFYRVGQILGQPVGGTLVHPEQRWDWAKGWWARHPFLLPCAVGCAYALFAASIGLIFLKETLQREPKRTDELQQSSSSSTLQDDLSTPPKTTSRFLGFREHMNSQLYHLFFSNILMCGICEGLFALYPLFCYIPLSSGGLGLGPAAIGAHMSIRSAIALAVIMVYSPLQKRFGAAAIYQLSLFAYPVTFAFFPALNWLATQYGQDDWRFILAVGALFLVWSTTGWAWAAITVLVSDHTPSKQAVSSVNAVLSMTTILPQALGPAIGTACFSWAQGSNFFWLATIIISLLASVQSLAINESEHDWREEDNKRID